MVRKKYSTDRHTNVFITIDSGHNASFEKIKEIENYFIKSSRGASFNVLVEAPKKIFVQHFEGNALFFYNKSVPLKWNAKIFNFPLLYSSQIHRLYHPFQCQNISRDTRINFIFFFSIPYIIKRFYHL